MSLLIIADKTVGPITDFHNLVNGLADDKVIHVLSQRSSRARFIAQHFTEAGFDVHNYASADNTIDSQVDRLIPALEFIDKVLVVGAVQASTAVAVCGILDAFIDVDRDVITYEG